MFRTLMQGVCVKQTVVVLASLHCCPHHKWIKDNNIQGLQCFTQCFYIYSPRQEQHTPTLFMSYLYQLWLSMQIKGNKKASRILTELMALYSENSELPVLLLNVLWLSLTLCLLNTFINWSSIHTHYVT